MKISDITCPSCASVFEVAESNLPLGRPDRFNCTVCGQHLDSWQDSRLRAYRLALSPEQKYRAVKPPPSPMPSTAA